MDMFILIRGLKYVFFDQSTWLEWFFLSMHLVKLHNPSQNG